MNKQMFSLSDIASEFRHGYGVPNTPSNRIMQFRLIQEEYSEFEKPPLDWRQWAHISINIISRV